MDYKINEERLMTNLFNMAKIGMNEAGGIDRALGSQADYDTRQWLMNYWKENLNCSTTIDPIANLWIEKKGLENRKPIVMGSHHDAVPDGGKYDGAMGVLIATEIMESIIEKGICLKHPLKVISFTGEEPNPFNLSTLGSKVISGRLKKADIIHSRNRETGESLADTIKWLGGDLEQLEKARIEKDTVAAFLEPHNELGGILEENHLSISSVSCITGIYREEVNITGEANHAGTTVMQNRKDAAVALSEFIIAIEKAAKSYHNPNVVATVGYIKLEPNEANIIPGAAKAIVDIRTCDKEIQEQIADKMKAAAKRIEIQQNVIIERKVILDQPARVLDREVIQAVNEGITKQGETVIEMVSMAGHDAANMSLITKAGMIFVQSVGGKGHCRQEYSRREDIVKAANTTFYALMKLDEELE